MLKEYFRGIAEVTERVDAREESFYSTLEEFIKRFADSIGKKNLYITTLPKKTEAGNPDFRVWDGKQKIIGYIEAKKLTEDNLDHIETTEQLERYRKTFPNLILTNFLEFRLYRDGELRDKVTLAHPPSFTPAELERAYSSETEKELFNLLESFMDFSLPPKYDAKSLAVELAKRTRFLKEQVIIEELKEEKAEEDGFIHGFYDAFKTYLIFDLTKEAFADLYAQTITYGLFAARTRSGDEFNRKLAYDYIPGTIGILRDVFKFISLGDLPSQMEWIVDDISEVLSVADVNQILHKFYHEGKGSDPIIHFYETFLAEYNPEERERRGVYYTPEPVVSYIVRSLDIILKEKFGKADGFADDSVTVLDPAAGTLTFIAEATRSAVTDFTSKYGEGGKENLIKDHILQNFYAFELMMAPYAVGHLKISFLLDELGYKLKDDDRFKLYLTNTLEMEDLEQTALPGMRSLSEESHLAGAVKKKTPILVILGNPPYSGISSNVGDWISKEIKAYYTVDGKPLGEKNPKWLQDDYVKFIRFAQWKINEAGEGILGFITNHSYLDNPTFRGMRQSLMESFNEIHLLDLHGNSLKKERCPDGSKDENVFDIRQGVVIALFIKKKDEEGVKVFHTDLWGLREDKYGWLLENDVKTTEWEKLNPHSEFYLFIPRDEALLEEYEKYWKVTDIFPVYSAGIATARDKFVFDFEKETLKKRIEMFRNLSLSDDIISQKFGLKDKKGWSLRKVRENLKNDVNWENKFSRCLYRPFDIRWLYYHDALIERPRKEVMHHMMEENLGLIVSRSVRGAPWRDAQVTNVMIEFGVMATRPGNTAPLFPLYLYPDPNQKKIMGHSPRKEPNIKPELIKSLTETYGKEPTPEEIFYYIYGVLYSNTYRTKYAEFLKIDFPRVPFTGDYELFNRMGECGRRLVDLHLMRSSELDYPIAKFQGIGDNVVEKVRYVEEGGRIYINKIQYFEGVEKEVWEYQIGGYQVLDKWLKSHKGRELTLEDIKHYCRVVTALKKTIEVQMKVDEIYEGVENVIRD